MVTDVEFALLYICIFVFFKSYILFQAIFNTKRIVDFCRNRTRIVRVEGELIDHLTNTHPHFAKLLKRNLFLCLKCYLKLKQLFAVVVAQLAERSIITPDVRGSNLVICNLFPKHVFTLNVERMKIKERRQALKILFCLGNASCCSISCTSFSRYHYSITMVRLVNVCFSLMMMLHTFISSLTLMTLASNVASLPAHEKRPDHMVLSAPSKHMVIDSTPCHAENLKVKLFFECLYLTYLIS